MPNAQREKEYLKIYADICKQNDTLIAFLVQLSKQKKTTELLAATNVRTDRKAEFATAAHNRWREAGFSTANHSTNQDGGGTGNGQGDPIVTPQ